MAFVLRGDSFKRVDTGTDIPIDLRKLTQLFNGQMRNDNRSY
jgi:hypothetical protein